MHEHDIAATLAELRDRCAQEDIAFAVVGALAMIQHGYVRHTEDIDIVTTPAGLDRIHERLVGLGFLPRATGLRKRLRDTRRRVDIDVIQTGEHAGSQESPVIYPDPSTDAFSFVREGVRYPTLAWLLTFKIASGAWGKRMRDFADAISLIKANALDESFAAQLPEPLRTKYLELLRASREEIDSV